MTMKPKLLHVTDLHYQSNARIYYEEDMYLSSQLNKHFDLVLCHPKSTASFLADVDVVLFRNTGPVMYFQEDYDAFRKQAEATGTKVFNELTGKGDMQGKQYLIDLSRAGYPVIPSIDNHSEIGRLPYAERYVVKLKAGADSIGMEFVTREQLRKIDLTGKLAQPVMDFSYEVSFYYINHAFQYALYAPDPAQRWKLEAYKASSADLEYADRFIAWNDINYGIQRIDACRMPSGELLLMEVEDINPYLSLDLLSEDTRNRFVQALAKALAQYAGV